MEEKRAKIKTTEQQELDKLQNQFDKFEPKCQRPDS